MEKNEAKELGQKLYDIASEIATNRTLIEGIETYLQSIDETLSTHNKLLKQQNDILSKIVDKLGK